MEPTYLKGLFLKRDGSVEPVTFQPDPAAWLGPEPVLQVMNDPAEHFYTFSVHLRSRLDQMYLSARSIMEMMGVPSLSTLVTVQTLSWVQRGEGWVQLTVGMKEGQYRPPNRGLEGFDMTRRLLTKGRLPYEPKAKKAKVKKARPAPALSPLLEQLMRRAR